MNGERCLPGARGRTPSSAQLCLAILGFVLGIWASPATAKTFRAGDNQVEDYPTVQALMFLDTYIRERTGGRHKLQVFHSGQLGDERNTLEQTRAGAIDLNRVNITPLTAFVPVTKVLLLPFLFRSTDHLHAVLDGAIGDEILAKLDGSGLVGLTFYDSGARSIYNHVRPVKSLADLAGLRIRVQQSDLMLDLIAALGAKPVPLSYGQVLAALQTKLIDGAENNWPSYVSTGHNLSARYLTLTGHIMPPEVLVISRQAWDALSPEDQAIFRAGALASRDFMRKRWRDWEAATQRQADGSGTVVTAEFDRGAFVEATQPVRDKYLADPAIRELSERILAVR